jgi:hypothetical protein
VPQLRERDLQPRFPRPAEVQDGGELHQLGIRLAPAEARQMPQRLDRLHAPVERDQSRRQRGHRPQPEARFPVLHVTNPKCQYRNARSSQDKGIKLAFCSQNWYVSLTFVLRQASRSTTLTPHDHAHCDLRRPSDGNSRSEKFRWSPNVLSRQTPASASVRRVPTAPMMFPSRSSSHSPAKSLRITTSSSRSTTLSSSGKNCSRKRCRAKMLAHRTGHRFFFLVHHSN